ncbi:MAG: MFS transporter, partial [Pseudomonadota bacterium]
MAADTPPTPPSNDPGPSPSTPVAPPSPRAPHLSTLIFMTAATPLALNLFLPALPTLASDLGTDYATATWAIAGYLAATGVVQLCAGPISDRIGRRPVALAVLAIFSVASVGCALAQDFVAFMVFRMLQAVMVAGYTVSLAVVRDTAPASDTATDARSTAGRIGTIAAIMAVMPMGAPILGGAIDAGIGWRGCFWLYAFMGAALALRVSLDLTETRRPNQGPPPARRLFRSPLFWGFSLCATMSTSSFYIFLAGAPYVAVATYGLSSTVVGVVLGSITLGFFTGSAITARLAGRLGALPLILAGRVVACAGLVAALSALAFGPIPALLFFAATLCVGLGNGLTTPSA